MHRIIEPGPTNDAHCLLTGLLFQEVARRGMHRYTTEMPTGNHFLLPGCPGMTWPADEQGKAQPNLQCRPCNDINKRTRREP
jgi:hypothetical protein